MKASVLLLCFITTLTICTSTKIKDLPKTISSEVWALHHLKKPTQQLLQAIQTLKNTNNSKAYCQTCNNVISHIINYRKTGSNKASMENYFQKLCKSFTDWGEEACQGYIDIEIDTVLYVIDNRKNLTSERVCSIIMQNQGCKDPLQNQWEVELPPRVVSYRAQSEISTSSPWKILHLTDFHYDPLYIPGYNSDCGMPLCCQKANGPPTDPKNAAGYWGDYKVCDMPWHSVTDFMDHLVTNHKNLDYVYYTGDIISHKSWATSQDLNGKAISDLYGLFAKTFKKTPVYPILGNHEPHPTDFFSPGNITNTNLSTQWVFGLVANLWAHWLPPQAAETIRKGGYYTVLVKPGFRIVALNSNVCYTSNLWLIYEDEDPFDQLKWLVEVLSEAEKNNEKVHILSHVPPGDLQCLQQWSHQFSEIVHRFASTITAQFNGHTHLDELRLFYDSNTRNNNSKKAIAVAFNGGSFTTFVGLNPNYRIYDVDQTTYDVLDYDQYTFNLTEANLNESISPQWFKLYSFKKAYRLPNTHLDTLANLVVRMSLNHKLVQDYFRYQVRESPSEMAKGCDDVCVQQQLCRITSVEAETAIACMLDK